MIWRILIVGLLIVAVATAQTVVINSFFFPAAGGGSYTANATTYPGDAQCWMERDANPTGMADGKACTLSVWLNFAGDDGVLQVLSHNTSARLQLTKQTGNTLRIDGVGTDGTTLVRINSTAALVAAEGWHHVLISFDKAVETRRHFYIDGVDVISVTTFLSDDVDGNVTLVDFERTDWAIGSNVGAGTGDFNGCMSEYWFTTTYIDLSVQANREKFRSAGGTPVDLGADGSTPTGTAAILYFKSIFSSWTVNSGTGGDFVKKGTTAFTDCVAP